MINKTSLESSEVSPRFTLVLLHSHFMNTMFGLFIDAVASFVKHTLCSYCLILMGSLKVQAAIRAMSPQIRASWYTLQRQKEELLT